LAYSAQALGRRPEEAVAGENSSSHHRSGRFAKRPSAGSSSASSGAGFTGPHSCRPGVGLMLRPEPGVQVYLYAEPVDMRKSIDGLSALVEQEMDLSPAMNALFVFCNRGRDKIKLLCWERNGFIVWYKRLEKQRFRWPKAGETLALTG